MAKPPNLSGDAKGYNSQMFKSSRAVRRGFKLLGYGVNPSDHKVPGSTVRQFQHDYNRCSERFGRWGQVRVTGKLNRETLNGLEHAVRWSKKRENRDGTPSARSWQALCSDRGIACRDASGSRTYSKTDTPAPKARESSFVEVLPNGSGKLRNIHTDDALRCEILNFELHGDVVFATVAVPPQGDLPGGRSEPITCPCVLGR